MYRILNMGTVVVQTDEIRHIRNEEMYIICSKIPSEFDKWRVVTVYKRPIWQYRAKVYSTRYE